MRTKKLRDAAVILTLLGPWLALIPTMISFERRMELFGVPLIVIYIFGFWLTIIIAGAYVAKRLRQEDSGEQEGAE
jgi:uncharacterized sodium:solute symporter family permease YidK